MQLLDTMKERLAKRVSSAGKPYKQFIYLADIHFKADGNNAGFEEILHRIAEEKDDTLFVLLGGDMVETGSRENYEAFIERCERFYRETGEGVPIIPTVGNHELYGVEEGINAEGRYSGYMGDMNFAIHIAARGLGASVSIVAFADAKPRVLERAKSPNQKSQCEGRPNSRHLFYFPHGYIRLPKHPSDADKRRYSNFPGFLDAAEKASGHILVTMHVPPRKDPLPRMLNAFVENGYACCLEQNPTISMKDLKKYYRNLGMLVHGNSTADKNDSTQWFADEISSRKKVEMVLMGHVHTYYPFTLPGAERIQMVISGGGGNNTAMTYDPGHPVTTWHYLRVMYSMSKKRFIYAKVDAGSPKENLLSTVWELPQEDWGVPEASPRIDFDLPEEEWEVPKEFELKFLEDEWGLPRETIIDMPEDEWDAPAEIKTDDFESDLDYLEYE